MPTSMRPNAVSWSRAARIGHAAWLFGNLYEGIVGMPQLLLDARTARAPGLLTSGSPVRYYLPAAPLAIGATAVAVGQAWQNGAHRRAAAAAGGGTAIAIAMTAYLVVRVNHPLLTASTPIDGPQRRRLIRRWHAVNAVRLAVLASTDAALRRLQQP